MLLIDAGVGYTAVTGDALFLCYLSNYLGWRRVLWRGRRWLFCYAPSVVLFPSAIF